MVRGGGAVAEECVPSPTGMPVTSSHNGGWASRGHGLRQLPPPSLFKKSNCSDSLRNMHDASTLGQQLAAQFLHTLLVWTPRKAPDSGRRPVLMASAL